MVLGGVKDGVKSLRFLEKKKELIAQMQHHSYLNGWYFKRKQYHDTLIMSMLTAVYII